MYLKVLTFPSVLEQGVFGAGGRKLMSHNLGGCGNSFQRRSSSETRRQAECGGGEGQAQELGRVELGLGDRLGLGQGPLARDSSTTGQRRFSQQLRHLSRVSSVLGAGENSPDCTFHSEAKVTTPWECIRYRLQCDDSFLTKPNGLQPQLRGTAIEVSVLGLQASSRLSQGKICFQGHWCGFVM